MTMSPDQKADYEATYATATIRPERQSELNWILGRLLRPEAQARYAALSATTGVPWFVIGILHMLEASGKFSTHRHNGDPLTARTVQVPKGRPKAAPANGSVYSWEESAADALAYDKVTENTDWSIAGLAYLFEKYNGFGYRSRSVKSPYLWSFSTAYTAGKFGSDGKYDPKLVSKQAGAMVLLKALVAAGKVPEPKSDAPDFSAPIELVREDLPPPGDGNGSPLGNVAGAPPPPPYPGGYIRLDSADANAVTAIQTRLTLLGIDPGGIDGRFGFGTDNAVRLFQARATDASGDPLDVDGIVGPDTWEALFGNGSVTTSRELGGAQSKLTAKVLEIAADEVGVREVPPGSNRGPKVDQYLSAVSTSLLGKAWCTAFLYWVFLKASTDLGIANPFPQTAGVHNAWRLSGKSRPAADIVTAAEAAKDPSLVRPGAVFFIDTGGGLGHVGLVVANLNGTLVTIEGNTSDGGSREGIGVFRRTTRKISKINLGFAHYS